MMSLRIENTADPDNTDLVGLSAASALSGWLLSPLLRGLIIDQSDKSMDSIDQSEAALYLTIVTIVTRGLLAAAVQHPDLHLHITLTPDTVTMVMLMVMTMVMVVIVIMSAALPMLVVMMMVMVMMMVVMIMGLLSGLLSPRGPLGPSTLLSHNHSRPRVNPLHSEEKRCQIFLYIYKIMHLADLESCLSIPLLESCLSILDRDSCLLSVKTQIRL